MMDDRTRRRLSKRHLRNQLDKMTPMQRLGTGLRQAGHFRMLLDAVERTKQQDQQTKGD